MQRQQVDEKKRLIFPILFDQSFEIFKYYLSPLGC